MDRVVTKMLESLLWRKEGGTIVAATAGFYILLAVLAYAVAIDRSMVQSVKLLAYLLIVLGGAIVFSSIYGRFVSSRRDLIDAIDDLYDHVVDNILLKGRADSEDYVLQLLLGLSIYAASLAETPDEAYKAVYPLLRYLKENTIASPKELN